MPPLQPVRTRSVEVTMMRLRTATSRATTNLCWMVLVPLVLAAGCSVSHRIPDACASEAGCEPSDAGVDAGNDAGTDADTGTRAAVGLAAGGEHTCAVRCTSVRTATLESPRNAQTADRNRPWTIFALGAIGG